jgi:outer membrane protein OmpA-like peptidoglycan-associated protein
MKKAIYLSIMFLMISLTISAQASGGQITRKKANTTTTQPHNSDKKTQNAQSRLAQQRRATQLQAEREKREREDLEQAESEHRLNYWKNLCASASSDHFVGSNSPEAIEVRFDDFTYNFNCYVLDSLKIASIRTFVSNFYDSFKETGVNCYFIVQGYRDNYEPNYIPFARAYKIYEELIKCGVNKTHIENLLSGDVKNSNNNSTEIERRKSRTAGIFIIVDSPEFYENLRRSDK